MKTKYAFLIISAIVALGAGVALFAAMLARPASASMSPGAVAVAPAPDCTAGWNQVPSPNGSGNNSLASVAVISANDVWAVGYYTLTDRYQTLTEHWDGNQWNIVSSPNPGALNSVLTGVSAASANDVWAVGWYDDSVAHPTRHLITMHWNGVAWSEIANPDPGGNYTNYLNGVGVVASNDVWAVGFYRQYSPQALIMHWNGSAWSVVPNPGPYAINFLNAVGVISASDVWAVGYANGTNDSITWHWDGSAWSVITPPTIGALNGIDGVASNDVWAAGNNGVGHWNGTGWTTVSAPNIGTVRSVAAIASNDVWAVGDTGIIHWDGSTWSTSPTPVSGPLYGVAAVSSNELWAVGNHTVGSATQTLTERYIGVCPTDTPTLTPTPTSTPCATNYTYTTSSGGSITQGTDLLPGSQCGRCTVPLTLPFPFTFYGQTYTSANVLSVGNVQFATTDTSTTSCLPYPPIGPAILPNWDTTLDTAYTPPCQQILGRPCGVYKSVSGSVPNRIFNIEWLTRRSGSSTYTARFELRLYESTGQFDFVYANIIPPPSGSSSSVGVQNGAGAFTSFECFVGGSLSSGLVVTWHPPAPCGPTYTPTPTSTPGCPPLRIVVGQQPPAKPAVIHSAASEFGFRISDFGMAKIRTPHSAIRIPDAPITFALDDGVRETSIGFGIDVTETAALWLNRFTPPTATYPITLNGIQILWPDQSGTGDNLPGKTARLLVYQDTDGDGNPSNATLLGQLTVTIGITETYENYPVNISVPGPTGDLYIGFEDLWAVGGYTPRMYPASQDTTNSQVRSWIAAMGSGAAPDINNLGNNDQLATIDSFNIPGNWLIRTTGTTAQGGCPPTSTPTATNTPALTPTRTPTSYVDLNGSVTWYTTCPTTSLQLRAHLDSPSGGIGPTTMRLRDNNGDFVDFPVPSLNYHPYGNTYITYCQVGPCIPSSWLTSLPYTLTADYGNVVYEYDENNNDSWETAPPAPCASVTPTSTPTPVALLVGHVVWQGPPAQPDVRQQLPVTLTLKLGSTEVNYPGENTDSSGFFTVSVAGMPGGTYQWRVKGPKYLANSGSVFLTGNPITSSAEMNTLRAGDANNDNAVSAGDFNILKSTFGKSIGDPGYDARADFTNDDVVNLPDFNFLKVNFGQGGAPPIAPGR